MGVQMFSRKCGNKGTYVALKTFYRITAMQYTDCGRLEIIFGPMFSGKTTELQRRIRRYKLAKKACLVVKFLGDTRYDSTNAVTHDLQKCPAVPCEKLADIDDQVKNFQVVGI